MFGGGGATLAEQRIGSSGKSLGEPVTAVATSPFASARAGQLLDAKKQGGADGSDDIEGGVLKLDGAAAGLAAHFPAAAAAAAHAALDLAAAEGAADDTGAGVPGA